MKTVQKWLMETDTESIIGQFLQEYPIDFPMLEDKNRTIAEVYDSAKENLRRLIRYLLTLEAVPTEEELFYAVRDQEGEYPRIYVTLSCRSEVLRDELPEHYAWEFVEWERVLGYHIVETSLTMNHIDRILAHILYEMTFFGMNHAAWQQRKGEIEASLHEAMEEMDTGESHSVEEVFSQFGRPRDEVDDFANELNRKIYLARWEYAKYSRIREAKNARTLLLKAQSGCAERAHFPN